MINSSIICYYQVGHLRRLFDAVLLALSLNVLPPLHFGTQKTLVPPPLQISKNVHVPTQKGSPLKESSSNLWWKNSLLPHLAARCMFR